MWLYSGVVFIKNIPFTLEHCSFHCKEVETLIVLLPCTNLASNAFFSSVTFCELQKP